MWLVFNYFVCINKYINKEGDYLIIYYDTFNSNRMCCFYCNHKRSTSLIGQQIISIKYDKSDLYPIWEAVILRLIENKLSMYITAMQRVNGLTISQDSLEFLFLRIFSTFCFTRGEGASLSVRSLKFMQLPSHDVEAFVSLHKHTPLKKQVCNNIKI